MSPEEPQDNRWCALRGDHQPLPDAGADAVWLTPDGDLVAVQVKQPVKKPPLRSGWHSEFRFRLSAVCALIALGGAIAYQATGRQAIVLVITMSLAAPGFTTLLYELALHAGASKRTWPRLRASVAGASVRSLTALAAFLAGREGPNLLGESAAHLRGESGHDPVTWATVMEAARWVITGVHYRGQDWALAAWKPVDAVLGSRFLSGLFVAIPTVVDAFEVLTHKGAMTVLTSFSSIFGVGVALAAAVRYGRKRREIELPEPKRRARADGQDGQDQ